MELSDEDDKELDTLLQDQANTNFKQEHGALPFWRLSILYTRDKEDEFTASFIFRHAIGDIGSPALCSTSLF